MSRFCTPSSVPITQQRGAVLVVALVILLVMGVMGVSSMMSSTLQERMTGISRQKAVCQYAAESALRQGEAFLQANIAVVTRDLGQFNGNLDGLYAQEPLHDAGIFVPAPLNFNLLNPAAWLGMGT